jgi:Fe-S cluster assembly iron-binding protein IscA
MLTLTESAKDMVRDMLTNGDAPEGSGLRISATHDTHGSPALALDLAAESAAGDDVLDDDGSRVFLEAGAAALLDDKILDAQRHEDHYHFTLEDQDAAGGGG